MGKPEKLPDIPIHESKAKVQIYIGGASKSILTIQIPSSSSKENLLKETDKADAKKKFDWWHVFCLDGTKGLQSLRTINKLTENSPKHMYCEDLYFNEPGFDSPVPRPKKKK